jgi:hypothetical protein
MRTAAKPPRCGTRQGQREKGLKRFFAQKPRRWLRSSTTPKAAHLHQPLLWRLGQGVAQK